MLFKLNAVISLVIAFDSPFLFVVTQVIFFSLALARIVDFVYFLNLKGEKIGLNIWLSSKTFVRSVPIIRAHIHVPCILTGAFLTVARASSIC